MAVEPVVQLATKYKSEFQETFEGLRQRSFKLQSDAQQQLQQLQQQAQQLEPIARAKKDELQVVLSDVSPIEGLQTGPFLETFAWTAVLEFGYALSSTLGSVFLSGILGLFLDTFWTLILAYVLLPYLAYKHIEKPASDNEARFKLLAFAGAEGLLVGFLTSERYLATAQPLAFLTPLLVGVVAQLGEGKLGGARTTFLGATLGAGVAAHLVLGLLGGLLSFSYLLLVLLYAGVSYGAIQLYLKYQVADQSAPTHVYQFGVFAASLAAQALVFFLLGGAYEPPRQ